MTDNKASRVRRGSAAVSSSVEKAAERLARAAGTAPAPVPDRARGSSIERSLTGGLSPEDAMPDGGPDAVSGAPQPGAAPSSDGRRASEKNPDSDPVGHDAAGESPAAGDAPPSRGSDEVAGVASDSPETAPDDAVSPSVSAPDSVAGSPPAGASTARPPVDLDALRERFATPDPREMPRGDDPGQIPDYGSRPAAAHDAPHSPSRRGASGRSPAADGEDDGDENLRRRRGVLGSTWAVIRFLLIGSKKPRKARKRGKPVAARAPRRPPRQPSRKLPAWMRRIGRRFRRLFPKPALLDRIPLPARLRALSIRHGIVRNVALLRGAEKEPTVNEKALDAARRRYAAADTHFRRPLDLTTRMGRTVEIDLDAVHAGGMVTPFGERTQIAEEFRLIKRPLLLNAFEKGRNAIRNGNVIMVASSRSGEGKTFTAINLAMSIATERDLTVLLIDADVAKPDIPHVLGFEADIGLVDLIADERIQVSDVILRTNIDNLSVMTAGRPHHLATELLASERMAQLVTELSLRYPERVVVMDSPPALLSSVAGVLALNVGQILFVVEAERTSQTAVDSAIGLVSACKNINLLLNKSRSIGGSERFGSYYSGYY